MENFRMCINAAAGADKSDLVLKRPWIVDVFNQDIYKADIAICKDKIVGIGDYNGFEEIDCDGLYAVPGFIDAHVHIESSRAIPEVFARVLIKKGVTTCIADPHEIANVMGIPGIEYMLKSIRNSPIDMYVMLPSCVPAVEFEDNGARLDAEILKNYINEEEVLGLGEVMDVHSVVNMNDSMIKKLDLFKGKVIDGHCPKISNEWLNAYTYSGIKTDHECLTASQAVEEIKRGMYVMLREGSAAKDLERLVSVVNDHNFHRFLFCTDDKEINDIDREGSIDHNIRLAVKCGISPIKAVTMATLNAAQCYGLKNTGAIAPGYKADLVILKDLNDVVIQSVIKNGAVYKENEYAYSGIDFNPSMNIETVSEDMFKIKALSGKVNVIKTLKGSIETRLVQREAIERGGFIEGIVSDDYVKAGVFERHKKTGKHALCFIEGLGLRGCSAAQTISHDSHNIIVVGDNDKDMETAVNRVIELGGGIVVISKGKIAAEIGLPVAGLMSNQDYKYVILNLEKLEDAVKKYKEDENSNIFTILSFMSLPVIPEVKITTRGLYEFQKGRFISLYCK